MYFVSNFINAIGLSARQQQPCNYTANRVYPRIS